MQKVEWFSSWFNTHYYHLLYSNRDYTEAEDFLMHLIAKLKPSQDAKVLDLACGKGRHSIFLAKNNFIVKGVDLSKDNIAHARQFEQENLSFEVCDMRALPFRSEFDIVLNLFTSFGYFDSLEDEAKVLKCIFSSLKSDGIVIIDYLNVGYVATNLVAIEKVEKNGVIFNIHRSIQDGFIFKNIEILDGGKEFHFQEKVRAIFKDEFVAMLSGTGFNVVEIFGDYELKPFSEKSPRLILMGKKQD